MDKELVDLFLSKVDKTYMHWIWEGRTQNGYGILSYKSKRYRVHRLSHEIYKGEVPKNMVIDHLCRITLCVNPEHLEAVTDRENIMRGFGVPAKNARKTKCFRGHPFDKPVMWKGKVVGRGCSECRRINSIIWKANHKEQVSIANRRRRERYKAEKAAKFITK